MMFDLVVNFRRELEDKILQLSTSNGSTLQSHDSHTLHVGEIQGLRMALALYSEYLKKLNEDED